eukprot:4271584-Prymnesium_polylepis.1
MALSATHSPCEVFWARGSPLRRELSPERPPANYGLCGSARMPAQGTACRGGFSSIRPVSALARLRVLYGINKTILNRAFTPRLGTRGPAD